MLALSWDSRWVLGLDLAMLIAEPLDRGKGQAAAYFLNGTTSPCPPLGRSASLLSLAGAWAWGLGACPSDLARRLGLGSCCLVMVCLTLSHVY